MTTIKWTTRITPSLASSGRTCVKRTRHVTRLPWKLLVARLKTKRTMAIVLFIYQQLFCGFTGLVDSLSRRVRLRYFGNIWCGPDRECLSVKSERGTGTGHGNSESVKASSNGKFEINVSSEMFVPSSLASWCKQTILTWDHHPTSLEETDGRWSECSGYGLGNGESPGLVCTFSISFWKHFGESARQVTSTRQAGITLAFSEHFLTLLVIIPFWSNMTQLPA